MRREVEGRVHPSEQLLPVQSHVSTLGHGPALVVKEDMLPICVLVAAYCMPRALQVDLKHSGKLLRQGQDYFALLPTYQVHDQAQQFHMK